MIKFRSALVILGLAITLLFSMSDEAFAARKRAVRSCPSIVGISGYIYKNYQPLRRGPNDHTLIGYQSSPTLLDNGGGSSRGNATIYDTKGNYLGSCQGLSCDDCRNHWRFKCTGSTSAIRRSAIRNTRSPSVLFKVGSKCVQVPDAGKCVGSVKGLCNRTLS